MCTIQTNTGVRRPLEGTRIALRQLGSISKSPHEEALTLKNCSFGWGEDAVPVVQDVDLSVRVAG